VRRRLTAEKSIKTFVVAYLGSNYPYYLVYIIDLIPVLALMPMPYYIFPNPSQNLKPEEETRRLRLRLSSTSVVCCTALCALGRGPVASSQTQRPLCPGRSQKNKIHLFPVCVAEAAIGHPTLVVS
jgi:hypothetical protein